jgi:DNA-binding transcriptional MerR regulator
MSPPKDLLKIGEFARKADTNLRTLRYYEELGLLIPAARSAGGFRYYRPSDQNRVRLIWDLQQLGLQLEQIATLLSKPEGGDSPKELYKRVNFALSEHDTLLQGKIDQLNGQRERIQQAQHKLSECSSCPHYPTRENNFCEPCLSADEALPSLLSALF